MEDSSSLGVWEDFSCVVVVVSTVFTVSFFVVLFVVVCVVLSFVVLPFVVLSCAVLSFVVLCFVLGREDSVVKLLEVEVFSVVDSFVVVLGVEGCVVVASAVDSCAVVMDFVVSFALAVDVSVELNCVAFRIEVGVVTVSFVVELLVEAVEFGAVPGDVVLGFTSVTFCVDVPLAAEICVSFVEVVFGFFADGVVAVVLIEDVAFTIVSFPELFVTFDVAGDCVVLETAEELAELLTVTFRHTMDRLPALVVSQCLVRFNVVPLHEGSGCVLFGEHISVKFMWIIVALACKVEFCVVQFEIVALHDVVALTAVEFCREEFSLLATDVVFTDDTFAGATVSFKGAALTFETQSGTKTVIATKMANT